VAKHPGGRPVKWTPTKRLRLRKKLAEYLYAKDTDGEYSNPVPNISEFAFENQISRQRIYEFEELRDLIELCHTKKERDLEVGALTGKLNATMAIFSLKQLGWTDKQTIEHSGSIGAGVLRVSDRMTPEEWAAAAKAHQSVIMSGIQNE
jgi:hypothetical protein